MTGRRVCPKCGTTYHLIARPPRVPETCDLDGTRLERRPDDTAEVVEFRQQIYDDHAVPILEHYRENAPNSAGRSTATSPSRPSTPRPAGPWGSGPR